MNFGCAPFHPHYITKLFFISTFILSRVTGALFLLLKLSPDIQRQQQQRQRQLFILKANFCHHLLILLLLLVPVTSVAFGGKKVQELVVSSVSQK